MHPKRRNEMGVASGQLQPTESTMRFALMFCLLFISPAFGAAAQPCPDALEPRTQIELYFGRNIGETLGVSLEAWAHFVDEEVTPRFPDGLSVIDIQGQWKDAASGRIVREPSKKLVLIVGPDDSAVRSKVTELIALYKTRFRQTSVLMTQQAVCVAF
jgi:Protein of unknown function (DUF3574)